MKKVLLVTYSSESALSGGDVLSSRLVRGLKEGGYCLKIVRIPKLALTLRSIPLIVASFLRGIDPRTISSKSFVLGEIRTFKPESVILDSTLLGNYASLIRKVSPSINIISIAHNNEIRYMLLALRARDVAKLPFLFVAYRSQLKIKKFSDTIAVFSKRNYDYFRSSGSCAEIARLYVPVVPVEAYRKNYKYDLLITGSKNRLNSLFVDRVVKYVNCKKRYTLVVAGGVSDDLSGGEFVKVHGRYDSSRDIYSQCRVALNMMPYGEGIKLKTIEAIENHTPVVGLREAFEGLELGESESMCFEVECIDDLDEIIPRIKDLAATNLEAWGGRHEFSSFVNSIQQLVQ